MELCEYNKKVRQVIKFLRKQQNWSMAELAEKLKKTEHDIYMLELYGSPQQISELIVFAQIFNLRLSEFFAFIEDWPQSREKFVITK
ncbi:MAG: helix-turn-helix transcriptional regulator [Candidatus Parcubacteria bacterium]|nr:helix-turn-helix transcriptional regulator [Candidatus Parcubacteria bacterium]